MRIFPDPQDQISIGRNQRTFGGGSLHRKSEISYVKVHEGIVWQRPAFYRCRSNIFSINQFFFWTTRWLIPKFLFLSSFFLLGYNGNRIIYCIVGIVTLIFAATLYTVRRGRSVRIIRTDCDKNRKRVELLFLILLLLIFLSLCFQEITFKQLGVSRIIRFSVNSELLFITSSFDILAPLCTASSTMWSVKVWNREFVWSPDLVVSCWGSHRVEKVTYHISYGLFTKKYFLIGSESLHWVYPSGVAFSWYSE